jgi:hypothetical protein
MKDGNRISVLSRLLEPISQCVGMEGARALATLAADAVAQARIADLAAKCNEDRLAPDERLEYETYVHLGNIVAILQAKARQRLQQQAGS